MSVPISINIITRDNPDALERCLRSVYDALYEPGDECIIVDTGSESGTIDQIRDVAEDFPDARVLSHPELVRSYRNEELEEIIPEAAHLIDRPVMKSFAAAREIARKASKNPVVFWIDTDDTFVEKTPGSVRNLVNDVLNPEAPKVNAIFLDYQYAFAPDGTCTTTLKRERFVLKDRLEWVGRCHETLIPQEGAPQLPNGYFEGIAAFIKHDKVTDGLKDAIKLSDARNYLILRAEVEEDAAAGRDGDPRTRFYLANAARGLKRWYEAADRYKKFLDISGSPDDRFASAYYLGGIYMTADMARPFDAIMWYTKANEIRPMDPRGFYGLARAYAALHRYNDSMLWYEHAERLPEPDGLHSYDPTHVHFHPHLVASRACKELGRYDKAVEFAQKALAYRPQDQETQALVKAMRNARVGAKLAESVFVVANNLKHRGPNAVRVGREICAELQAVPPELEDKGIACVEPPESRGSAPNLAIWCGHTGERWSYKSAETGMGGSEKMVMLISAALQARGVNVSVYCNIHGSDRGIDPATGVVWRHWAEFDEKRPRDALVFWRQVEAVTAIKSPAKVRMLWNHDVQNPARYTDAVKATVDLVQCQSEYHAAPLRDILPPEKIWVARNAIDEAPNLDWSRKDPKLVVYMSSPDRGLLTAARIVEEAQKTDPEIRLLALYGFSPWARKGYAKNAYMHIPDLGRDWCMDDYEKMLYAQLDKVNAHMLGRVGFDAVKRILAEAGVWLYPTRFPEISCMSAMEAMAHGVIPVTTRFGALNETLPEGAGRTITTDSLEAAAQELLSAVSWSPENGVRKWLSDSALEKFAVGPLADEWIKRLGLGGSVAAAPGPEPTFNATLEGAAAPCQTTSSES